MNDLPTDRAVLLKEIQELFGATLGYPAESISEDQDLAVDLGMDSLRRAELVTLLARRYGFPEPQEMLDLSRYTTVSSVLDAILEFKSS